MRLYISYGLYILYMKLLPIDEYNYVYCKKHWLLYQLLLSLKYFPVGYYLQKWMLMSISYFML